MTQTKYKYTHDLWIVIESYSLPWWETPVIEYVNTVGEPDFYLALKFDMLPSLWFKRSEVKEPRIDKAFDDYCDWIRVWLTSKDPKQAFIDAVMNNIPKVDSLEIESWFNDANRYSYTNFIDKIKDSFKAKDLFKQ